MRPIDELTANYSLLGATIDSAMARLSGKNSIPEQEFLVLQGVYLFGVRAFEAFLENQIIHLCNPQSSWGPKVIKGRNHRYISKVRDARRERVKAIILMGASYANYLPYDQTLKKAEALFVRGHPFSLLDEASVEVIKRACIVRNLIAHESAHSLKQFDKHILSKYNLLSSNRNASGYLVFEAIKGLPMAKADLGGLFGAASFLS